MISGADYFYPQPTMKDKTTYRVTFQIKIQAPKGVSNGQYISILGEGNQSNSGSKDGDLIVYFEEKEHKLYTRDGQDIYIDCYLHYHQIVNGTEIDIIRSAKAAQ